jgi:hypothetical protein
MSEQVASTHELVAFQPIARSASLAEVAGRLFETLAPLHELRARDVALLQRAAAALRFIRVTYHHGGNERSVLRSALEDLPRADADVVEVAADLAADGALLGEWGTWERLNRVARLRALWYAGILRLTEPLDAACNGLPISLHAAWTDELLHLEVDGPPLPEHDVDRVRGRAAALEALTGRRVLFTSSARRRGAA